MGRKKVMNRTNFSEYVNLYRKQLYIIAYSVLQNEEDTEDAVCNAILKGYERLEQLRNPHKFKSWMCTITKNEALQIKRKRMLLVGDEKMEEIMEPVLDEHRELWDMVQKLQEEYRMVIVLFYYADLSVKEISNALDIPVGTVKSRLNRGRNLLKEALDK